MNELMRYYIISMTNKVYFLASKLCKHFAIIRYFTCIVREGNFTSINNFALALCSSKKEENKNL